MSKGPIVKREASGRWTKGASPNPGGRSKGLAAHLEAIIDLDALVHRAQDIALGERVIENGKPVLMPDGKPKRWEPTAKHADQVTAIKLLLDRRLGLPKATVEVDLGRLGEMSDGELEQLLIAEVGRAAADDQLRALVEARFGPRAAKKLLEPIDATAVEASAPPVRSQPEDRSDER